MGELDEGVSPDWRRARNCDTSACVWVKPYPNVVYLRGDDVGGPVLVVSRRNFAAFIDAAKAGEFDE